MLPKRMGSEKPGSEVLQEVFLEKEGPDRKRESSKVHQKSVFLLPIYSFLWKEKGTLPTSRMWMDARFASAVEM